MKLPSLSSDNTLHTLERDSDGLIEHLPCVVIQTDLQGSILYLSQHWRQLTGYAITESLGNNLRHFIVADDHEQITPLFQSTHYDQPLVITLRCLCADQQTKWIQLTAHTTYIEGMGNGIVGVLHDISEQVGREATLLANHRTVKGILNDLQGMVFRCRNDPNWTMQYVSAGSLALTGYRPRQIINNHQLTYGSLIVAEDRDQVWNSVQLALNERSSYDIIYHIRTRQGELKRVWERGKGIYSDSNDLLGLEGFIADIGCYQTPSSLSLTEGILKGRGGAPVPALGLAQLIDISCQTQGNHGGIAPTVSFLRHPLTGRGALPKSVANASSINSHLNLQVDKPEFHQRLLQRHRQFNAKPEQAYALIAVHLDKCRRYCENRDIKVIWACYRTIRDRVTSLLGAADTLYYEQIDDLSLLIDQVDNPTQLHDLSKQLHQLFLEPVAMGEADLYLTLSVGITMAQSEYQDIQQVLTITEQAMMAAHEVGGNRTVYSSHG